MKATIIEKDSEITNLPMNFNAATAPMNADEFPDDFSQVFEEDPNTKMGEDLEGYVVESSVIEPDEPKKKIC